MSLYKLRHMLFLISGIMLIMIISLTMVPIGVMADEGTVYQNIFMDIFYFNKNVFDEKNWIITVKDGVKIIKSRPVDEQSEQPYERFEYLLDKKNWYMKVDRYTDTSTTSIEAAMYFKNDKTPIVALSVIDEGFGGGSATYGKSSISFHEFGCVQKGKADKCIPKNVTREIFPVLTMSEFLKDTADVKKLLANNPSWPEHIKFCYSIPRHGTAITAYLWRNTRGSLEGLNDLIPDRPVSSVSDRECAVLYKNTVIKINWIKGKGKFEVNEVKHDCGAVKAFGN